MRRVLLLAWTICCALAIPLIFFGATGQDDSHISFFPAWALANLGKIVNYNGEAIEQSSSLLFVLLLGGIKAITNIKIAFIAFFLGLLGTTLTVVFSFKTAEIVFGKESKALYWIPILVGTQSFLLYWTLSGMETTLAAGIFMALIFGLLKWLRHETVRWLWLLILAFTLIRPEAGIVLFAGLAIFQFFAWIHKGEATLFSSITKLAAGVALLFGLLILIRLFWTGMPFPNPVMMKSSLPFLFKLKLGLRYIWSYATSSELGILILLLGVATIRLRLLGNELRLLLAFAIAGVLFILGTGGDWMECGRFWVMQIPILILIGYALIPEKKLLQTLIPSIWLCINIGMLYKTAAYDSTGSPIWAKGVDFADKLPSSEFSAFELRNRSHLAEALVAIELDAIIEKYKSKVNQKLRIMSGQAGLVMNYNASKHFGEVEWIDFYGLATSHVRACTLSRAVLGSKSPYRWDYANYLEQSLQHSAICPDMRKPDIIFDLNFEGDQVNELFVQHGFRIVYDQRQYFANEGCWKGKKVNGWRLIAVSDNLFALDD